MTNGTVDMSNFAWVYKIRSRDESSMKICKLRKDDCKMKINHETHGGMVRDNKDRY
jgi:hypothetical protein